MTKEEFNERVKPGVHVIAVALKHAGEMIVRSKSEYSAHLDEVQTIDGGLAGSFTRYPNEIVCVVGDKLPEPKFKSGDMVEQEDDPTNRFKIVEVTEYMYITETPGYLFFQDQDHFVKVIYNPYKGIDDDKRETISCFEALERYVWETRHGEISELKEKYDSRDVEKLFHLGFIHSNFRQHWNITKKGQRWFDLRFKPRTFWERIQDFLYFKVLKLKLNID